MNHGDREVLRAVGRAAHGSMIENGLPVTAEQSSKSTEISGGSAPLKMALGRTNASTGAFPENAESNTATSQSFPDLKSSLAVRMGQPTAPPALPISFAAPSELDTDAAPIALPAIIEKAHLKAESRYTTGRLEADRYPVRRTGPPLGTIGLIAAFGAAFLAGLLSAYAFYATKAPPLMAAAAPLTPSPPLVWPSLLAPVAISPRGQTSNGITSDQAFELADAKLRGIGGPPDAEEAQYWLRVGVAEALGGERLSWALTQLGTLYAKPAASPSDFATARAVWELAAAKQDPVALCFLARLEERGHGGAPNKALALQLFQQAKETGQCNGSEQAIERLSR